MDTAEHDWIVVGSGFGGSVAALRLAEKGYDVTVVEKGRRFADTDFASSAWQVGKLLWAPFAGLHGIMAMTPFSHVTVISGVGVGGGSLVYGNTLYVPHSDDFYRHPQWNALADWRSELAPYFDTAKQMLGVTTFAGDGPSETLMRAIAADLGVEDRCHATDVGVFLGAPGVRVPTPISAATDPNAPVVSAAGNACSVADTTRRTPWRRTTSTWPRNEAPESNPVEPSSTSRRSVPPTAPMVTR